jgi:DNA-binding winged helix-turn-helix (wHTH) protein
LDPPLSNQLFLLLSALYKHAPEIVSNVELMDAVWPPHLGTGDDQNLRKLVTRLRERIEPNIKEPRFIQNIKGRGYWLKLD